jgi:hypothetical protein
VLTVAKVAKTFAGIHGIAETLGEFHYAHMKL